MQMSFTTIFRTLSGSLHFICFATLSWLAAVFMQTLTSHSTIRTTLNRKLHDTDPRCLPTQGGWFSVLALYFITFICFPQYNCCCECCKCVIICSPRLLPCGVPAVEENY